jgi:FKBP-type peptidyl-prolyl cis-trans isomerase (trigger factor)
LETYLKTQDLDEEGLREEATPSAESRLKRSLVLLEIAQQEDIDVSEDDLQQETERTLDSITQYMSESDRKKFSSVDTVSNLAGNLYAEMRMNRTLEYLRNLARGEMESEREEENGEDDDKTESEMDHEVTAENITSTEEAPSEKTQSEAQDTQGDDDLPEEEPDEVVSED